MAGKEIDTSYCYIEDAASNPNWGEIYDSSKPATYKDPDNCSKRLYQDLFRLFAGRSNDRNTPAFHFVSPVGYSIRETSQSLFGKEGTRYKSDFIGVNRKLAHMAGISDSEIVEYLKKQRTIGGHMIFPVGRAPSINQAKGINMLERFDFSLAELREYFIYLENVSGDGAASNSYSPKYSKLLGTSFKLYEDWMKEFCMPDNDGIQNFKNFITYWMLDMFVSKGKECKVISLVSADLEKGKVSCIDTGNMEPYFPGLMQFPKRVNICGIKRLLSAMCLDEKKNVRDNFERYIKNMNFLIAERNKKIQEIL